MTQVELVKKYTLTFKAEKGDLRNLAKAVFDATGYRFARVDDDLDRNGTIETCTKNNVTEYCIFQFTENGIGPKGQSLIKTTMSAADITAADKAIAAYTQEGLPMAIPERIEIRTAAGKVFDIMIENSGALVQHKANIDATRDPNVNDDVSKNFDVDSRWVNIDTGRTWYCTDNTDGAAAWE